MRNRIASILGLCLLLALPDAVGAQVIDRTDTIGPWLGHCIEKRTGLLDVTGLREATFRMSFRADGSLIGEPRRTYSFPAAEQPDQTKFLNWLAAQIRACAPLPFSKELGGAMAGRPYSFRYGIKPRKDTPA